MGPEGMHPPVLRELAGVAARPLLIVFDQSWHLRTLGKCHRNLQKEQGREDPGNYRLASLTSVPGW